jgi:hypothetical protein
MMKHSQNILLNLRKHDQPWLFATLTTEGIALKGIEMFLLNITIVKDRL